MIEFILGFALGLSVYYGFLLLWRSWRHLGSENVNLPHVIDETPKSTPKRKRNMWDT